MLRVDRLKNRLISSILIGIIAVIIYILILNINGFEINESNLFILFMLPELLLKLFLIFFALTYTLTSISILFTKYKSKTTLIHISIGLIVVLAIGIPEINKHRSNELYKATENEKLSTSQVMLLYEKAIERKDERAIANLAIHRNLPDSVRNRLSKSEYEPVRQKIAWKTNRKKILIELSRDKNWNVRMAVAGNNSTPLQIVDSLQHDPNEYVKNTAFSMYKARTVK
jgi:hypothetical protein